MDIPWLQHPIFAKSEAFTDLPGAWLGAGDQQEHGLGADWHPTAVERNHQQVEDQSDPERPKPRLRAIDPDKAEKHELCDDEEGRCDLLWNLAAGSWDLEDERLGEEGYDNPCNSSHPWNSYRLMFQLGACQPRYQPRNDR